MWVKICANTCVEDALAAAEFGADAVGFVFAPGRRQVSAAQVRAITDRLPDSIETVGVFLGEDVDAIASSAAEARVKTVQLHGGLNLPLAHTLRERVGPEIAILHTAHWAIDEEAQSAHHVAQAIAELAAHPGEPRLLVDAKLGSASGGLGVSFDWERARPALAHEGSPRLVLAGGLRPENVAVAIRTLRPWGVDVASGVEQEPGRKDRALLKAFIANAKAT